MSDEYINGLKNLLKIFLQSVPDFRTALIAHRSSLVTFWCAHRSSLIAQHFLVAIILSSFLSSALTLGGPAQLPISLRWVSDSTAPGKAIVEVTGLSADSLQTLARWKPAQWQQVFSVHAGGSPTAIDPSLPAMLGAYRISSDVVRFEPQFPLEPGLVYRAVFRPDRLPGKNKQTELLTAEFRLPPRDNTPTTIVSQIYPSGDVLPENLLKFYIHFSAPMSRGRIYDHITLREKSGGKAIELPFLEIDEELWDPAMQRLTLFIDPGRIKRGVRPLEEIGPALEEGKSYTLIIGREWRDGAGKPLREAFEKQFYVGPPDREPLAPDTWKINPPAAETREALALIFPEPLDQALALRLIQVTDERGNPLKGTASIENRERLWRFIPLNSWRRGSYRIVVQTTIEDLAGNNIGKPFEVDLFEGVQRKLTAASVKLSFQIR
jgi:hypothetical protein